MTTIRVEVTLEHIARGSRRECEACPVALAIGDALRAAGRPARGVAVGFHWASVQDGSAAGWGREIRLPAAVGNFVRSFDRGEPAGPLAFHLNIPEEVAA
jgi:hypothetical protein